MEEYGWIFVVIALLIGVPVLVVVLGKNSDFKNNVERIKVGMTLNEVTSIMEKAPVVSNPPIYKWERTYRPHLFVTKTFHLTCVFEDDKLKHIDSSWSNEN